MIACIHKFMAVVSLLIIAVVCVELGQWLVATLTFMLAGRIVWDEW